MNEEKITLSLFGGKLKITAYPNEKEEKNSPDYVNEEKGISIWINQHKKEGSP